MKKELREQVKRILEAMEHEEKKRQERKEQTAKQEKILKLQESLQEILEVEKDKEIAILSDTTEKKKETLEALEGLGFKTNVGKGPLEILPNVDHEGGFIVLSKTFRGYRVFYDNEAEVLIEFLTDETDSKAIISL